MSATLVLGAVAYDPKVVTIWEGFKVWFAARGLDMDFVLYATYERQVAAHLAGHLDVAWNSPLAWLQTERAARARGRTTTAVAMRDTDRDLTSVIVVRADSPVQTVADLRGRTVAVGAPDSPQATLIPLAHIAEAGLLADRDFTLQPHDLLRGKHGDHIGGEREAARALVTGKADAACMIDGNHLAFRGDGTLPAGATRILAQTVPYDHCNMTVLDDAPGDLVARFVALLLGMSYDDPAARPLLDMEGLKAWLPGRTEGYLPLAGACLRFGTLDGFLAEGGARAVTDAALDLGALGLDRGGHLLLQHALRGIAPGERLELRGTDPALAVHLRGWCRARGHAVEWPGVDGERAGGERVATIVRGTAERDRWRGAARAGGADAVAEHAAGCWGLAARGARVEAGAPEFHFRYTDKRDVWADEAGRLYAQAAAAQWDPATAVDWAAPVDLPDAIEDAVVQVMTYLIENETAALLVPARFLGQIHPHFREVLQVLAIQAADEARHIEVFTRRALLRRPAPALSTGGGQASLKTLLDEPDFALASFLLAVLGEGTFLSLLWFLHQHAPDPVTRQVAKLTAQDEARHVAFGLAHLRRHVGLDPTLRGRLAAAVAQRHQNLQHTAGLNEEVFDALVLLAAGSWSPEAVARGFDAVVALQAEMDEARQGRLKRLGFSDAEAAALSALHTRNFM